MLIDFGLVWKKYKLTSPNIGKMRLVIFAVSIFSYLSYTLLIHSRFSSTPAWSDATVLNLTHGPQGNDEVDTTYWKSTILHEYVFGYEIPDLIMLLKMDDKENNFVLHVMGTKKKIAFLQPAAEKGEMVFYTKNKADNNQANYEKLWNQVVGDSSEQGEEKEGDENKNPKIKVGTILKEIDSNIERGPNALVGTWERDYLQKQQTNDRIELVDCAAGLSHVWSVKDDVELDLMKKSSVLSNKLMKHGAIVQLETIINEDKPLPHETLAQKIDSMIEDPSAIDLKIPPEDVASCYFPIVQSGGSYDFRVSAVSSEKMLQYDIVCLSLGARYQNYCSNIARTFLVDAPKAVSVTYELLLGMHDACRQSMVPGKPLRNVYQAAVTFLKNERPELVEHLPKNLGFAMGLEFRDSQYILNAKNGTLFKAGMVFTLNSVLQKLILTEKERSATPKDSAVRLVVIFVTFLEYCREIVLWWYYYFIFTHWKILSLFLFLLLLSAIFISGKFVFLWLLLRLLLLFCWLYLIPVLILLLL